VYNGDESIASHEPKEYDLETVGSWRSSHMRIDWSSLPTILMSLKYLVFATLAISGWLLLSRGRPMKRTRLVFQCVAFLTFGGVAGLAVPWFAEHFGLHPSPMCAISKGAAFVSARGVYPTPMVALIAVAVVMTLVGGKAFCGWVCPLGAMQELIGRIPGLPRKRMPFAFSNGVRVIAAIAFAVGLAVFGTITYDWFNPFEALHWTDLTHPLVWAPFVAVVAASLVFYRPFCALLCPMGLLTWALERASLGRIRVTSECDDCGACVKATDCQALPAILDRRSTIPDCHGCGDCLGTCKREFLQFSWKLPTAQEAHTGKP
jgi:polyferredoxin